MKNKILLIFCLTIPVITFSSNIIDSLKQSFVFASDSQRIDVYNQLARKHLSFSVDTSHLYCDSAIDMARNTDFENLLALSYKNKGVAYYYQGLNTEALNYYKQSIEICESINDKYGIASNSNNMAIIYQDQGEFDLSIQLHLKALEIREQLNLEKDISVSYNNIGNVYGVMGNHEKAIEYQEKALKISEKLNDSFAIGNALNNLGSEYSELKLYEKAFEYHKKALTIRKSINDMHGVATSLLNLGLAYQNLGDYTEARKNMEEALTLSKKIESKRIQISALECLSLIYIELELFELAMEYLNEAEKISSDYNFLITLRNVYQNFAKTYLQLKDTGTAFIYYKKFTELNDSLIHIENTNYISELETKYQTAKKDKEIETLLKDNQIQDLQLQEQKQRIKGHRLTLLYSISLFILVMMIVMLYLKWNKTKQKNIQSNLEIKSLLTEQKMLRSQMDPHFIYNSLNSIQSYISSKQAYQAERYLARFARLMRGILENSRVDFVLLEKEIELLEIFMELEQLRFDNSFEFKIDVYESITTDYIAIPPMVIQPFLENSIIHGFKNRKDGLITLKFNIDDDYLYCIVEDNGIGRKASMEMQNDKNRESLGMQITRERLVTMSEQMNVNTEFKIIDLLSEGNDSAIGTKVEIKLPYKEM